jgi:hypothetical protein
LQVAPSYQGSIAKLELLGYPNIRVDIFIHDTEDAAVSV